MSEPTAIDVIDTFLPKLLTQFKEKPNIEAILRVILKQVQDLEDAAFVLLTGTLLPNAVGNQLDRVGQIVGESRQGRGDADYRVGLSARILLNLSNGTIEELIAIVNVMTSGTAQIDVTEAFPAAFDITVDTPISNGSAVGVFVLLAKPAGVLAKFRWFEAAAGTEFRFDTAGQGFDQGLMGDSVASP
ncbi:MAG: DUF2612 domain-containing protein [Gammaproteobacteria bacterium]|nr:DUF2612 domain-containing protein [Gammaproteobacteria bacterium]